MSLRYTTVDLQDERFTAAWQAHVAPNDPSLQIGYLRLLGGVGVDQQAYPVIGLDGQGKVRALAYFAISTVAITRCISLRILALGGMRTSGAAFWFDPDYQDIDTFIDDLTAVLKKTVAFDFIVLKDFIGGRDDRMLMAADKLDYLNMFSLERCQLPVEEGGTFESYLQTLSSKKRHFLKQIEKGARRDALSIELVEDPASLAHEIYPLYRQVCSNARESKSAPMPIEYFMTIGRHVPAPVLLTVRRNGALVAFGLLIKSGRIAKCLTIGMDHAVARECNLWYVVVLESIRYAIGTGSTLVDLGSTNYAMKRKFDPMKLDVWVSLRHRSRWVNRLFAPLIRKMFMRRYSPPSALVEQEDKPPAAEPQKV